jgi:Fe-S-cluster containining protein
MPREEDGSCVFLKDGQCSIHDKKPMECRIFPLEILEIDGKLTWVVWEICPVHSELGYEKLADEFEAEMLKKYSLEGIKEFVKFHRVLYPCAKYADLKFKVIRQLKLQKEIIKGELPSSVFLEL